MIRQNEIGSREVVDERILDRADIRAGESHLSTLEQRFVEQVAK